MTAKVVTAAAAKARRRHVCGALTPRGRSRTLRVTTTTRSRTCLSQVGAFSTSCRDSPVHRQRYTVQDRFNTNGRHALYMRESSIITDNANARSRRDLILAVEIIRAAVRAIAKDCADHAIRCGSGYMSAGSPTGGCPRPRRTPGS